MNTEQLKMLSRSVTEWNKWRNSNPSEKIDLRWAKLRWAKLQGADLQGADLHGAKLQWADLKGADLKGAKLQGADIQGAKLQGANIDFTSWPIWCGGLNANLCEKNAKLLGFFGLYYAIQHFKGATLEELLDWVNTHHRVNETGEIHLQPQSGAIV